MIRSGRAGGDQVSACNQSSSVWGFSIVAWAGRGHAFGQGPRAADAGQYFQTDGQIGYVVPHADSAVADAPTVLKGLHALPGTIRARMLYTRQ